LVDDHRSNLMNMQVLPEMGAHINLVSITATAWPHRHERKLEDLWLSYYLLFAKTTLLLIDMSLTKFTIEHHLEIILRPTYATKCAYSVQSESVNL
jgi:hypothetical protein